MRRYGWTNGNVSANGNCVLLETVEQHPRGTTTSYMRRPQEDLSTDSCGENIRYQAVEGLVQNTRHKIISANSHLRRSPAPASVVTTSHWGESASRHRFQAYAKNLKC